MEPFSKFSHPAQVLINSSIPARQYNEILRILFDSLERSWMMLTGPTTVTAECTDVHVVFARGSGEMPGLGICGTPLVSGIKSNLAGLSVSSYAVNYLASVSQTSAGPGATDMTKHVTAVAQQCPNTVFVLGGIPEELAPRIKAIVTFGNPLKLMGQTIERSSQLYGSKAIEFCNLGDPVLPTASTRWPTSLTRWWQRD
ncbi:Alpha/Beta hydrolase fold [Phytophthora cactorum]|nr:Alpha/Beta hydrolase fold [Phytophthora cactorum]